MCIFDKIFHYVHRFQIAKGDYKFKKASNMQKISWNDDLAILGLSMWFLWIFTNGFCLSITLTVFTPGYN